MNPRRLLIAASLVCGLISVSADAETVTLDASVAPPAARLTSVHLGEGRSPSGHVISVNTRYLTLDGKPWLPVMGEFHYSRFPHQYWEEQLRKMKAAGVDVVSTYIIWQHHQDKPGSFDFTGDNDLRKFIESAQRVGLYVYLRPGPWAHAEVRYGGIPDFVVDSTYTRSNDPQYLAYVSDYFKAIGKATEGLLWKDGGPIIGIQIENEYNRNGPLQGAVHIAELKKLLLKAGMDVPLYSVTGWDNTTWPKDEALPVFGSYVDEPWSTSTTKLPPKSSYFFQHGDRVERGLGAVGGTISHGDADLTQDTTPFLGAEYGAGVPTMYRRRPIIQPDDIASMVITKIGSGVNLMGYYMFQGGQNPQGLPSREENTSIGGYNDLPKLGYDFGAPLGEYGEARPVLNALRPIHEFLNAFGDRLAPMAVYMPDTQPADPSDLQTLRWSVRGDGKRGFLFVNNYVRQYAMVAHDEVRFDIKLGTANIKLPPVTVSTGAYFVWPLNFDLSGINLSYATAQPLTRLTDERGDIYVFSATTGVASNFAFGPGITTKGAGLPQALDGKEVYTVDRLDQLIYVGDHQGHRARILVVSTADAGSLAVLRLAGKDHLVVTQANAFEAADGGIEFRQTGDPVFKFSTYPHFTQKPVALNVIGKAGIFTRYEKAVPSKSLTASVEVLREPGNAAAARNIGPKGTAIEPLPEAFGASGKWQIVVPADALTGLSDAYLRISYKGDIARLFSGGEMLDDAFYDGKVWSIGLKRYAAKLQTPLTLTILPLKQDAKIMLDETAIPTTYENGQVASVEKVELTPEYSLSVKP